MSICDRLVLGMLDQELSQKLQVEPDLDLARATAMARQHELVVMPMKEQRQGAAIERHRSSGRGRGGPRHFGNRGKLHKDRRTDAGTGAHSHSECTRCATVHKQGKCSARRKKCHKCQKMSYFHVVVGLHKQSTNLMQDSHRAIQNNHRQVEQSIIFLEQ